LSGQLGHKDYPGCILACDALACKRDVEVTARGFKGLDASDFDFDGELFESLLSSRKAFLDFVKTHWDRVLHAAFVFQIQPLDPDLPAFLVYAQAAADGKAREAHARLLSDLKVVCGKERFAIGAFGADGDSWYDPLAEVQSTYNLRLFEEAPWMMPGKQHYFPIPDILHLLKRARYRMLKKTPMVVGLDISSAE
jgi:hypothetical protein